MKKFAVALVAILAVSSLGIFAYLYYSKPEAKTLYREALNNVLNAQDKDHYLSFNLDAKDTKVSGEIVGDLSGEDGSARMDMEVSSVQDEVPMTFKAELISLRDKGTEESYIRYKSFTSSNPDYNQNVVNYYEPGINKWIILENDKNEDASPSNFENDGPLAAIDVAAAFLPISEYSEEDKKIFFETIDKYSLYEVENNIEKTKYRGIELRKLKVSIHKEPFTEFERELKERLSKKEKYVKFEKEFIDQIFGKDNKISANIYLDKNEPVINGLDLVIDLDTPVEEKTYNTTIDKIDISILLDYGRTLTLEMPKDHITQEQFFQTLHEGQ